MRARYLGDHVDFVAWKIPFPRGVFVTVTDPHAQKKISGNREFQVEDSDAEEVEFREVVAPAPVDVIPSDPAPAVPPDPAPEPQANLVEPDAIQAMTTDQIAAYNTAPLHVRGKPGPKPKAK